MPPTKRKMHPFNPFNLYMFLVSCNLLGMLLGNCNKNYAFYANLLASGASGLSKISNSDNYNFKCSYCPGNHNYVFYFLQKVLQSRLLAVIQPNCRKH